jgi:hypothetical protein
LRGCRVKPLGRVERCDNHAASLCYRDQIGKVSRDKRDYAPAR